MARILLDVGAHIGETLEVALRPEWEFDRIYCFEPASSCWPALDVISDDRVTVCKFGLWIRDEIVPLHDAGAIGASLFSSKSTSGTSELASFRDAAEWFRENLDPSDEVLVKMNCEGAECDLIMHLLASGSLSLVDELVVHFDVRKVPGLEHKERETREALSAAGISFRSADEIFFGRNVTEKTANWLRWYTSARWRRPFYSHWRRLEFALRIRVFQMRNRLHVRSLSR